VIDEEEMFTTEIVVIGEVMGRWNSKVADDWEREIVPRTLMEVAAESGWQFVDYDGRPNAVKAEWLHGGRTNAHIRYADSSRI
jgi:hypothetical protein